MAGDIKAKFGTNNQAITCTITSLASATQRGSTAIDNTTNVFLDALVQVKVKTGTIVAPSVVNIYAYGTSNGGTDYTDGVSGVDGNVTLTSPPNAILIGTIQCPANTTTYVGGPLSVAAAFNGTLPDHWGIVVENLTGAALDASVGSAWYQGVLAQYT
jgi:hypothetical protein